jgi:enamine deaminase RidA (YjgF/YER057c/UK114 family)
MVLKIERFQPEGMNVRMSGGKPSYSHVVTVSGSGKIVYTAGQLARDIDGNCVGKGDMRAQMEQTFQNLTKLTFRPRQFAAVNAVNPRCGLRERVYSKYLV